MRGGLWCRRRLCGRAASGLGARREPEVLDGAGRRPRGGGLSAPDRPEPGFVEAVVAAASGADLDVVEHGSDDRALAAEVERVPGFSERVAVSEVAVERGCAGELAELLAGGGEAGLEVDPISLTS